MAEAGGGAARHTGQPVRRRTRHRGGRSSVGRARQDLEGCNPPGTIGAPPTLVDGAGVARGQQASYFQAPPSTVHGCPCWSNFGRPFTLYETRPMAPETVACTSVAGWSGP